MVAIIVLLASSSACVACGSRAAAAADRYDRLLLEANDAANQVGNWWVTPATTYYIEVSGARYGKARAAYLYTPAYLWGGRERVVRALLCHISAALHANMQRVGRWPHTYNGVPLALVVAPLFRIMDAIMPPAVQTAIAAPKFVV